MILAEYKKHIFGEATKGIVTAILGAVLLFFGQKWFTSEIEYRKLTRDAYIAAPLGQQGLTMVYDGKALKNVSVVEFSIVNRTSKQMSNIELLFLIEDSVDAKKLVSSVLIPPKGISQIENIEELKSSDPKGRKFRIKVLPKQNDAEFFHAVFVFDGEKAPPMSVSSANGEIPITPYMQYKDGLLAVLFAFGGMAIFTALGVAFGTFLDYFQLPKKHKRKVEEFTAHACELRDLGKLKLSPADTIEDVGVIYASFTRPKPSKWWSKVLPEQRYDY
jgi:hypothetical protein